MPWASSFNCCKSASSFIVSLRHAEMLFAISSSNSKLVLLLSMKDDEGLQHKNTGTATQVSTVPSVSVPTRLQPKHLRVKQMKARFRQERNEVENRKCFVKGNLSRRKRTAPLELVAIVDHINELVEDVESTAMVWVGL